MKNILKRIVKPTLISLASHLGPHTTPSKQNKLWVLMYHRILPANDQRFSQEEPGMVVQPETFEMHIKETKKNFDLISLGEWVKAKENGEKLPQKACAITFDDGWLDNFEYAFPILKAESTPATLFIVAEKIGTDFQFWPNIITALLQNGASAEMLKHPQFQCLASLLNTHQNTPSRDDIARIITHLKQYSDEVLFGALADIEWKSLCAQLPPALMSWEQVREVQASGLVEIGSHTCNHKRLTHFLSQSELEHEIITSKTILEQQLHSPVNLFCFPNGDYNQEALSLVKSHYRAAVTTRRGINRLNTQSNLHELTRIGLHEEVSNNKKLFRARLSSWV